MDFHDTGGTIALPDGNNIPIFLLHGVYLVKLNVIPPEGPGARKSNVSFSLPTEETTKAATPIGNKEADAPTGEPAACVTPAQQKREDHHQPPLMTDHADDAMNLEEAARKESVLNNPSPEEKNGGWDKQKKMGV